MRALIQRVNQAEIRVDGQVVGQIERGIITFLGIGKSDIGPHSNSVTQKLIEKIARLRIFEDESGKMNRSLLETQGEHLIVSQFTLFARTESGTRPGFSEAAPANDARPVYEQALRISESLGLKTAGGKFQADMKITLTHDGPVTLFLEMNS